jgi:hypothetical protein
LGQTGQRPPPVLAGFRANWPGLILRVAGFANGEKNVSLVSNIRRTLYESPAAAPCQASVPERPVALPPAQAMELQMWTAIFALTFATAIIFSVASVMLHTKYLARLNV